MLTSLLTAHSLLLLLNPEDQRHCGYVGVKEALMYVSFYLLCIQANENVTFSSFLRGKGQRLKGLGCVVLG